MSCEDVCLSPGYTTRLRRLAAGAGGRPGVCVEHVYLQTLLLMRLDSGNFTPDQVEWVARQLEDWTPTLALTPRRGWR